MIPNQNITEAPVKTDVKGVHMDVTINFPWGTSAHIKVETLNIIQAVDQLFDKLDEKVTREKDKIQDHE